MVPTGRAARLRRAGVALAVLLAGAVAGSAGSADPAAAAPSRAVVVIDTGSSVRTAVVNFSGTITGLEALALAGAGPVTYGYAGQGAAVCALDGVGHPATDACLGTPSDPRYWSYWRAPDGASGWSYAGQCACATEVRDGDVEGWRFGTGSRPPFRTFCAVVACAPPPPDGGSSPVPAAPVAPPAAPGPAGPDLGSGAPAAGPATGPGTAAGSAGPAPSTDPDRGGGGASAGITPTSTASADLLRRPDAANRALGPSGAAGRLGGDGGPGSPVGVLAAAGVVAAIGATAMVARRRHRRVP